MQHQPCTATHRRPRPAHCGPCGQPWPCRDALLAEAEQLRADAVEAGLARMAADQRAEVLEAQLTTAMQALAMVEEELAEMNVWVPVDQHGGTDG